MKDSRSVTSMLARLAAGAMVAMVLNSLSSGAHARVTDKDCGPIFVKGVSGPWEYRLERLHLRDRPQAEWLLKDVEKYHFPPKTELLIKPVSRSFGADISYTLDRYANHHRALATLVRLGDREGTDQPKDSLYSIECRFNRAARFTPDDTVVRGMYAEYLARRSRPDEAREQLIWMERAAAENPLTYYNIALLYTEIKMYEEALTRAHKALELGMPNINELRRRLVESGHWREPGTSPLPRPASGPAESPR